MTSEYNQKICFIAGAGHSGSTLLGLILGSHTTCFYGGELSKTRFLGNKKSAEIKRVCKLCGPTCPIWQDFVVSKTINLYEQISIKTQKSTIIDSAKGIAWLQQQIESARQRSSQIFLIFLQRDGRAVINSRLRKYPAKNITELTDNWLSQIEGTQFLFNQFQGEKMKVRYEELVTRPAEIVRQLCRFLRMSYEDKMLAYYQHEHHPLGGNTGTQFLVARGRGIRNPYLQLSDWHKDYYTNHPVGIQLDLRWQEELPAHVQKYFEETAGHVNEEMRWEG